jgi:hypothetical protein
MRRAPGILFIAVFVFAFSANLRAGTNDLELTPRNGVPARVMLKGCHKLESIAVDFNGDGDPYQAQWWRCGSPDRKKGRFPVNYVLVQPPRNREGATAITLSNAGSSAEYFIEQPQKIDVEPGSRQLLLVSGRYYDSDQGKTSCLLGPIGEGLECWPPPETEKIVEASSHKPKSLFRKVDDFLTGQNLPY